MGEVMIANGSIKGAKQGGKNFDHMKTREVTVQKKTNDPYGWLKAPDQESCSAGFSTAGVSFSGNQSGRCVGR